MATQSSPPQRLPQWRYILGIVGVLVATVSANSLDYRDDPHTAQVLILLLFFLAVVWGCVLMVPATGTNAVAHHSVVGVVIGFLIGGWDTKVGPVLGLIGAFVGALLGLVVGCVRAGMGESVSQSSVSAEDAKDGLTSKTDIANNEQPRSLPPADR